MTRYYALYARHREIALSLHKKIPKSKHRILLDFNTCRKLILLAFVYDTLHVQSVIIKWSFWNFTTITSLFLWNTYMKGQWQNFIVVPVVIPLDLFFCLLHTETI